MNTNGSSLEHLSDTTWFILSSLKAGPQQATELQKDIAAKNGTIIEPGNLYRTLDHLERRRWIERYKPEYIYYLTENGRAALENHRIFIEEPHRIRRGKKNKENHTNSITWILQLYPLAWRKLYEEEMKAFLEGYNCTFFTFIDLLFGAVNVWFDPYYKREKNFFSFKDERIVVILFMLALGIIAGCMSFWFTFTAVGTQHLLPSPQGITSMSYTIAKNSYILVLLLIILSNICIIAMYIKKAITKQRGTLLFTAIFFLIPFFFVSKLTVLEIAGMEILMGNVWINLITLKEAIITRQKWLLFLTLFVNLLFFIPSLLHLFYFYSYTTPNHMPILSLSTFPTMLKDLFNGLWIVQLPLTCLATTTIVAAKNDLNKKLRKRIFLSATFIALIMVAYLFASTVWNLSYWLQGQKNEVLTIITILLFAATGVAFLALRREFKALATDEIAVKEATEMPPLQSQH